MLIEMWRLKEEELQALGPDGMTVIVTVDMKTKKMVVKVECPEGVEVSYKPKELILKKMTDEELSNKIELERKKILEMTIRDIGIEFDVSHYMLKRNGYIKVGDLTNASVRTIARIKWIGPVTIKKIREKLNLHGLDFKSKFTHEEILEMDIEELELDEDITFFLKKARYTKIKHIVSADDQTLSRIKYLNLTKIKNMRRKIENLPAIIEEYHNR